MLKLKPWTIVSGTSHKKKAAQQVVVLLQKDGKLPYKFFEGLKKQLGVSEAFLSDLLFIKSTTLGRRKKEGYFTLEESDRIARLIRILEFATTVFEDEATAIHWFKSPQKALGNKIPLEISKMDSGCRAVEDLLGRIQHGIFS